MIENVFPQSGKIAIVDDQFSEVEGLIEVLSKSALPFVCLRTVPDDYCTNHNSCFRVVFLDLVFGASLDEKNVASMVYSYLSALISEKNGPYVLAIWSTKGDRYQTQIDDVIKNLPCKPDVYFYLNKEKYKTYNDSLYKELINDIGKAFEKCGLLHFLSVWENSINRSASSAIAEYDCVCGHNRNIDYYTSVLSKLMLGQMESQPAIDNEQRLISAYEGINALLAKQVVVDAREIAKSVQDHIKIKHVDVKIDNHSINTLLWIAPPYNYKAPKNVYSIKELPKDKESVFSKFKDFGSENIYVLIDMTNKCYFAQNKITRFGHHLVRAILVPNEKWNKDEKNDCILNIGEIVYCEKCYRLVVLLNEVIHFSEGDAFWHDAIFSVSDEVYNEIRAGLGYFYTKSGKQEL